MLIEQHCVVYFRFLYLHQSCDEFEQVNSVWLMLYVFSCKGVLNLWLMSHDKVICEDKIEFKNKFASTLNQ